MPETVVLRASLPLPVLLERFVEAVGRGASVDLVIEGRTAALFPRLARRLDAGGREALQALAFAPLFPKPMALLLQARRLGRTFSCRAVTGAREIIVEIRPDTRPSRER